MAEQTVVAAESSAAPVAPATTIEVERGPLVNWTPEQRTEFRRTGEMPKPEESAPSKKTEPSKGETSSASEAGKTQEKPGSKPAESSKKSLSAEDRIAQLESTIEKIRKGAGIEPRTPKAESSPAPVESPKPPPVQQQQFTRTKPTVEDKGEDGNPKYKTYEEFVEDLSDWKAEQRIATVQQQEQQKAQSQEMATKINEARTRYGQKFDEVLWPTLSTIVSDAQVNPAVKAMLNDSDIVADVIFTIGSDQEGMAAFMTMAKTQPGKALRYIALTENLIHEELESKAAPKPKTESEPAPVKPQSSAPKPPAEVGGRAATPGDALEAAAQAGDFRSFKAESTRRALARLRG